MSRILTDTSSALAAARPRSRAAALASNTVGREPPLVRDVAIIGQARKTVRSTNLGASDIAPVRLLWRNARWLHIDAV